jgi:hypothetical protein
MFKLRSFLSQLSQPFLLTLSQEKVVPNCPRLLPELFTSGFSGLKRAKQVPLARKTNLNLNGYSYPVLQWSKWTLAIISLDPS